MSTRALLVAVAVLAIAPACVAEKAEPVTTTTVVAGVTTITTALPVETVTTIELTESACRLVDRPALEEFAKVPPEIVFSDPGECRVQVGPAVLSVVLYDDDLRAYKSTRDFTPDAEDVDDIGQAAFYSENRLEFQLIDNGFRVRMQLVGGNSRGSRVEDLFRQLGRFVVDEL